MTRIHEKQKKKQTTKIIKETKYQNTKNTHKIQIQKIHKNYRILEIT